MNFTPPPILLVEDNEDDAILVKIAFEQAGIECSWQTAEDGQEAILYLSGEGIYEDRSKYPMPLVVLVDLTLPRKSGHEVLAWMQQRKELQSVVRVVLTGSDNPEDVDASYALGAQGYLLKPITQAQLRQPGRTLRTILLVNGSSPPPAAPVVVG